MTEKELFNYFYGKFSNVEYDTEAYNFDANDKDDIFDLDFKFEKSAKDKLIKEGYNDTTIKEAENYVSDLIEMSTINDLKKSVINGKENFDFSTIVWDRLNEYDMYDMKKSLSLGKHSASLFEDIWYLRNKYYNSGKEIPNDTKYFCLKTMRSIVDLYNKFREFVWIEPSLMAEANKILNDRSILETIDLDYIEKSKNIKKRASKKISISSLMPESKLKKYNLCVGQTFESQKELSEYCDISRKQIYSWKKDNFIEEI